MKKVGIGEPPKLHSFDLVSDDETIFVECKAHHYTATDKAGAKFHITNSAALGLLYLPREKTKIIVMKKSNSPKRTISFAQLYVSRYGHLLSDIIVLEADVEKKELKAIRSKDGDSLII
jgi:hypothetical protein